jgi:hypothetical protein
MNNSSMTHWATYFSPVQSTQNGYWAYPVTNCYRNFFHVNYKGEEAVNMDAQEAKKISVPFA